MSTHARRVLGRKDTNTRITSPSKYKSSGKSLIPGSPTRLPKMTIHSSPRARTPPSAGTKRKIEQVEDVERDDRSEVLVEASQRTHLLSDTESEHEGHDVHTSTHTHPRTSYQTADTSLSASQTLTGGSQSQTMPPPPELQFELPQEEMSQRTLDKLNAVPMPQNTSQLPPHHPQLFNETSAGSIGLSAFLNLEEHASSQASAADNIYSVEDRKRFKESDQNLEQTKSSPARLYTTSQRTDIAPSIPAAAASPSFSLSDTRGRRQQITVAAEQLRARLQLALFKVQSNQTRVPFSRLKRPRSESEQQQQQRQPLSSSHLHRLKSNRPAQTTSSSPVIPLGPPQQQQGPQKQPYGHTHTSSTVKPPSSSRTIVEEDHIASLRAAATSHPKPAIPNLSAVPHPVIKPTATSARWANVPQGVFNESNGLSIDDRIGQTSSNATPQQQFPSSPPLSRQNSSNNDTIDLNTDQSGTVDKILETQVDSLPPQLSSPPMSERSSISSGRNRNTAPATTGEAASGLLALAHS